MEFQKDELEIDLVELYYYLKKKIVIIVAAFLVCAVAGFVGTKLFIAPQYTASTRMYVLNRSNESNIVYSDIQISTYMSYDYEVLITGQNVTKEVVRKLGLDIEPDSLAKIIKVTAPDNTRVLQIDITYPDAQLAADIANTVREVASEQIQSITEVDAVKTVYEAEVPEEPSSPNAKRNTVLAAALGMIGAIGVLVVLYVMDDTIRTEEDVERYLGLGTLGVIPISTELRAPVSGQPAEKKTVLKSAKKSVKK